MELRNTLNFNSEQSYAANKSGKPIMVTPEAAEKLCRMYGETLNGFFTEQNDGKKQEQINSWDVLLWLGF